MSLMCVCVCVNADKIRFQSVITLHEGWGGRGVSRPITETELPLFVVCFKRINKKLKFHKGSVNSRKKNLKFHKGSVNFRK